MEPYDETSLFRVTYFSMWSNPQHVENLSRRDIEQVVQDGLHQQYKVVVTLMTEDEPNDWANSMTLRGNMDVDEETQRRIEAENILKEYFAKASPDERFALFDRIRGEVCGTCLENGCGGRCDSSYDI